MPSARKQSATVQESLVSILSVSYAQMKVIPANLRIMMSTIVSDFHLEQIKAMIEKLSPQQRDELLREGFPRELLK